MGVSVVIAVKNEEANLKRCLEAVKWADEIVIVNNGSRDNTLKIAKKYTDKIYLFDKPALIPEIQQFGIDKAAQDWILVLDADVIVTKNAKKEILEKINDKRVDGYYLPHRVVAFGKPMRYALFCNILKLFRKDRGRFDCSSAHCILKIKGNTGVIKNHLLHYAHPDIETFVRKMNLYTSQDAKKIVATGRGGLLNKKIKRVGIYNLVIEPLFYMNYLYFIKRYYKDGRHGLLISLLMGYYLFLERAKVFEIKYNKQSNIRINREKI